MSADKLDDDGDGHGHKDTQPPAKDSSSPIGKLFLKLRSSSNTPTKEKKPKQPTEDDAEKESKEKALIEKKLKDKGGEKDEKDLVYSQDQKFSLWKLLSSFIGKDAVSVLSLPLFVFEPTTFIQLLAEPMQFMGSIEKSIRGAADPCEKLAHFIAFLASYYQLQTTRTKKPFNPTLGETFDLVGEDGSFKFFAEQVSHHPPVSVASVSGPGFWCSLELGVQSKFHGNSMELILTGLNHFHDVENDIHYTADYITSCANNIIIGKMYIDHYGDQTVKSSAGHVAHVHYSKCGFFGGDRGKISAKIYGPDEKLKMKLSGKWNEAIYLHRVDEHGKVGPGELLWACPPPMELHPVWKISKYCQALNTITPELDAILLPTDSRRRPDRRALEVGDTAVASAEKRRIEEMQRTEEKARKESKQEWVPKYFKKVPHPMSGYMWTMDTTYWEEREARLNAFRAANVKADVAPKSASEEPQGDPVVEKEAAEETPPESEEITTSTSTTSSHAQDDQ